jgi:hypothetical protein
MASKHKTHWPTAHTLYFLAGLLVALVGFVLRHHSLSATWTQLIGGSLATFAEIGIGAVIVVLATVMLRHRYRLLGWASGLAGSAFARFNVFARKKWYYFGAWFGAGLAIFGIAQLFSANSHTGAVTAMLAGPLALLLIPSPALVGLVFVAYTLAFAEEVHESKIANHKGGKGSIVAVYRNAQKVARKDAEWADAKAPEAAHFAQLIFEAEVGVIDPEDAANRVSFGIAHLAPDWGKKKTPIEIGAPAEGSVILIGASGSGKTLLGQRAMLSTEKEDKSKGILATKWVCLSVKSLDIAGVVAPYFRSIGMPVWNWDLNTRESDPTCGDPVTWAPNMGVTSYDQAKAISKRLAESASDPSSATDDNPFWLRKSSQIIAVGIFASVLRKQSFEKAVRLMQSWDDPMSNDVETILELASDTSTDAADALRDWRDLRSSVLDRIPDGNGWASKATTGSDVTGQNIGLSFSALMQEIATQAVYDATANPTFDPKTFIRTPGSAAVFLIGNRHKEGMTRSLLAPVIEAVISEAEEYANEQPDERLPYRLVIFADELPNLAPIKGLDKIISRSRSTRIAIIVVAQGYSQLQEVYGRETARTFLNAATATLVLSGIQDPEFIGALNTIGGTKQVELGGDLTTPHALIEGQHLLALRAPNTKTGAPGSALMIVEGAIVEVERPLWTFEERFDDRGTVLPQFVESTVALRATRPKRGHRVAQARALASRVWAQTESAEGGSFWRRTKSWAKTGNWPAPETTPSEPVVAPEVPRVVRPLTPRPSDLASQSSPAEDWAPFGPYV